MLPVIKHSLTEEDNETYDLFRLSLAIAMIAFVGLAIYSVIKTGQFDMVGYGTGFGALLGGGGLGVGMRAKFEPRSFPTQMKERFNAKPNFENTPEGEGEGQ